MAAPTIYRSTDTNAPVMFGGSGTLISVLDACLVDGYGSTFATGTITNDAVNVTDLDTFTVGSTTYTFKTSGSLVNSITIGANAAASMQRLVDVINFGGNAPGGVTQVGTVSNAEAWATLSGSVATLTARKGGTSGNAIALSEASTHLVASAATLTGGGGTNTKASVGWTKPFSGSPASMQAVYRQPAGCGFYLQVDDNVSGSISPYDARTFGFETMTAWNTGTGQFPTVTQATPGAVLHKTFTISTTLRPWMLIADDRTFYLFVLTGDQAPSEYLGYAFGDFYSLGATDAYKCLIIGRNTEGGGSATTHTFGQGAGVVSGSNVGGGGHWLSRNFTGIGGSTAFVKAGDIGMTASTVNLRGELALPNGSDGGLYLAPVRIVDGSTPGTGILGNLNLRGRMRGIYHAPYPLTTFADGDTFPGSGEFAGRTFLVVRNVLGSAPQTAFVVVETTAWETSS